MKRVRLWIIPALSTIALAGCVAAPTPVLHSGNYATPIGSAPVTSNDTAYSGALFCLARHARMQGLHSPRIAVGRIQDYTGKQEDLASGPKLTQGASLMAMTALGKAGARLVERFDNSVTDLELKYANGKLISDAGQRLGDYRKIPAGVLHGSDFVLIGGLTELNFNIRSDGAEVAAGGRTSTTPKGVYSRRSYVMNIGLDLRLVDTRTSEVVDMISYQKQIAGVEVGGGLFSFIGDTVIDIGAGSGALEPVQLAVRSAIERATLEFMSGLYGLKGPELCLAPGSDPLSTSRPVTAGLAGHRLGG
jgi:curli biogenesis system outer membrane secretion channel CsgG